MEPTDDIEDVEILKARYDTFEQEMKSSKEKVVTVNALASQLLNNAHPNSDEVIARQNQLNQRYADLQNLAGGKKSNLDMAHDVNTWHIECNETMVRSNLFCSLLPPYFGIVVVSVEAPAWLDNY